MSCSKIISGDIPELTNKILQYFRYDYSTLHSCSLVNRSWCRLAIPLLWEDPFSIPTKNYHFIGIYLHNLNEDDKTKLNEYGINDNLFPSNTLFKYPSFIKYFDTWKIIGYIKAWTSTSTTASDQCLRFIYKALLKTFIENEACLYALIIGDSYVDHDYLNDLFEIILQNPNFIHNIKKLILDINKNTLIKKNLLTLLPSKCNFITTLDIRSYGSFSIQIINSQQNLKKITFRKNYPLYHLLLSLKNSNCSNTLKTIIFFKVNFCNIVILSEVFEQLNVLESVHLFNCLSLDFNFVQQIINITKPFKLKSLIISDKDIPVESFQLLLQKSGDYLENIGLSLLTSVQSKHQLFEIITKYCTRIKVFELWALIEPYIYSALDLIKNFGQNLNYLTICGYDDEGTTSSIVSRKLGQVLPFKLEYLNLVLDTNNTSDFEVFLKNSQNTFINTLLIFRICTTVGGGEDIINYIEKYIMKNKRVKNLSLRISEYSEENPDWDLFYMKDVVKKLKLYNIEVQDYLDVYFDYQQRKKNDIEQILVPDLRE